jgi:hypothetical protein
LRAWLTGLTLLAGLTLLPLLALRRGRTRLIPACGLARHCALLALTSLGANLSICLSRLAKLIALLALLAVLVARLPRLARLRVILL